jgi:hypothetical protein
VLKRLKRFTVGVAVLATVLAGLSGPAFAGSSTDPSGVPVGDAADAPSPPALTVPAVRRQLPAGFQWAEQPNALTAAAPEFRNISNPNSGRCIGISTGLAGIWDCTRNSDQLWTALGRWCATDGLCWWHFENDNGACLGIWGGSTDAGARAVGYSCLTHEDQYWRVLSDGRGHSYFANMNAFYSSSPAYILGTNGGLQDNGTQIVLFWPDGTYNQRWCWVVTNEMKCGYHA